MSKLLTPPLQKLSILKTEQLTDKYGKPGDPANHVSIKLPFPMVLAWDKTKTLRNMVVHRLAADQYAGAFAGILAYYGQDNIKHLGINLFGGCFNHRPKRGCEAKYAAAIAKGYTAIAYSYLSTHSWAIAIDLDPARNTLREKATTARFARPEYKPMIEMFYKHGILGYGPEKNYDWMHFEIGAAK